ncbi:DNA alkylation repair protein [Mesobacillus selenatarsenatis]|uniref:DNA alkylation repair enzyme n=1 Tax=Mesobacillus selenatarsenatis (strain DSM 18680 / JCM 14380 / FERM P-15431 / SF-1) TaxID=1321606 RepID=A0A0A8X730_MESS1|nr:DNA alkylation repair protein [Mesobacillus selenatarsenatis]GAM15089.1 DNA alkylation repair enzyme [Mesobacillus selenatarsenatis SF-1]
MNNYVEALYEEALKHRNREEAVRLSNYMRNQFEYIGLRAPQMQEVFKQHVKTHGLPAKEDLLEVISSLWKLEEREMQMSGAYLLDLMKKQFTEDDLQLLKYIITTKPWWDTVDHIAKKHFGYYLEKFSQHRQPIIDRWIASDNIWLIRSCILFQLGYKERTDVTMLEDIISRTCHTKEFFINKAIGWALREYAKQNPEKVFEITNRLPLSNLSRREALKHIGGKK